MTMSSAATSSSDRPPASTPRTPAAMAQVFHALSDPARLRLLQHLTLGEHQVRDLVDHVGLAQSTVSAHLACLRDCGLVRRRAVGRSSYYSIVSPEHVRGVFEAVQGLLADLPQSALAHEHQHGEGASPDA